ncbi:MAG: CmcI family methyltransferase [Rhodospirillales bacterium]|nr:CmcI family methyltransferase [Rhodospirillales bacterium]
MLTIDETRGEVRVERADGTRATYRMDTDDAFAAVSAAWLRCGWDVKYVYGFTWLGRPVIQLPEDLLRMQEVLWRERPDVVVETGVAHGGSLVFHASLCALAGSGRVIGIDRDIRPATRTALAAHALAPRIALIEGDSAAPATLDAVRARIAPGERVLVVLDSGHARAHVRAELDAYAPLIAPGGLIVACDGIMAAFAGAPRSAADWGWNNPLGAIDDFLAANPAFRVEEPAFPFNEGAVRQRVTYWPRAFLRRAGDAA